MVLSSYGPVLYVHLEHLSRSQDRVFPDRRRLTICFFSIKPSCHNLFSNSRIRSDACLLTNKVSKTQNLYANGVVVFEGSPIRYNNV